MVGFLYVLKVILLLVILTMRSKKCYRFVTAFSYVILIFCLNNLAISEKHLVKISHPLKCKIYHQRPVQSLFTNVLFVLSSIFSKSDKKISAHNAESEDPKGK